MSKLSSDVSGWFGESWGAPACSPETHRPTPVGATCEGCGEDIGEEDQGFISDNGHISHLACLFRGVMGGFNHIIGTCKCCGGDQPPDPPGLTRKQQAEFAMVAWEAKQNMSESRFAEWVIEALKGLEEFLRNQNQVKGVCPICEGKLAGAYSATGRSRAPRPGDVSTCHHCGSFLKFDKDMKLIPLPPDEFEAIPAEIRQHMEKGRDKVQQHRTVH